jgi:hypothetical protein
VVVAVGATVVEPLANVELNVPGEIEIAVAPLVDQLSVLFFPEPMLVGFAVKEAIVGTEPGGGLVLLEPPTLPHPAQASSTLKSMHKYRNRPPHSRRKVFWPEELGVSTLNPPLDRSYQCKERPEDVTTGRKDRAPQ